MTMTTWLQSSHDADQMTRLLRCTPPLSDRHRRWDGAESSPASPSGEAWHARGGLCAMAPSCADFLTGTAEWAPDEAEEKKYKYCVVIGGCPRPSPSFFSLCKHCKDTCAVDWLVARPREPTRIPAGSSQRSSRLSGAKTRIPRGGLRRATPPTWYINPRGQGEAWWTPRDCVTGGGAEPSDASASGTANGGLSGSSLLAPAQVCQLNSKSEERRI